MINYTKNLNKKYNEILDFIKTSDKNNIEIITIMNLFNK